MKNSNKLFNLKVKWRFLLIISFLILSSFSAYYLLTKPELSPSDLLNYFPETFLSLNSLNFLPKTEENSNKEAIGNHAADCVVEERPLKVRGDSMSGLIEDGTVLKILINYYQCRSVERNDLVVYSYPGGSLLTKIIRGIPGDRFQLEKSETGCWNILINNEILKNSQNTPYCFNERGYKMLSLYEKDYKGVIPENAYLILGNLVFGSLDSSSFGLIGKRDILGKVEI